MNAAPLSRPGVRTEAMPGQGATVHHLPRRTAVSPMDWPLPGPEDRSRIVQVRYTGHAGPDPDAEARRIAGHPHQGHCASATMASVNPVRAMASIVRRLNVDPAGLSIGTSRFAIGCVCVFRQSGADAEGRPVTLRLAEIDQGLSIDEARAGLAMIQRGPPL